MLLHQHCHDSSTAKASPPTGAVAYEAVGYVSWHINDCLQVQAHSEGSDVCYEFISLLPK